MIRLLGALAVGLPLLAFPPTPPCSVRLLLQFDGSLKRPSDPGFSTASLGRMAACAASLTVVTTDDDDDDAAKDQEKSRLVLLGGKSLGAASTMMTSGAVEYEGLLIGLEGLQTYIQDIMDENEGHAAEIMNKTIHITVQGDCKTVIEQMSGVARPRKLQDHFNRATAMVFSLLQHEGRRLGPPCGFQFQHIPRAQNVLCDRIAARILLDQQQAAHRQVQEQLRRMLLSVTSHLQQRNDNCCSQDDELRSSIGISGFLLEHFSSGTSLILYSKRPSIYHRLADMAAALNDWTSLLSIGAQLQSEVETVWTQCAIVEEEAATTTTSTAKTYSVSGGISSIDSIQCNERPSELLMVEALAYQILAFQKLGREKEARNLRRKKQFLLSKHSARVASIEGRLVSAAATNSLLFLDSEHEQIKESFCPQLSTTERNSTLEEEWPLEVVEWHDEFRSSSNHWTDELVFWGKWKKTSSD